MKLSLLLLSGALLCTSALNADTMVFTNLGSGFNATVGLSAGSGVAIPFTDTKVAPDGSVYVLSTITVAFIDAREDPLSDSVTVALYSDAGGLPGTLLASQSFLADTTATLETVTFANGPILSPATNYWLALSDDGNGLWNFNEAGAQGAATFSTGTSTWTLLASDTQGAAEVDAALTSVTPEPGTLAMLGGGLFALILFAARRRFTAPAV